MRALTQVIGTGESAVRDIPAPGPREGQVLVRSHASVISAGTEATLLDFGRSSFLGKARSQPDRVRQVFEKAATEGLVPTLEAVRDKLHETIIPGYCQAGRVLDSGGEAGGFSPGDLVVTNGPHAEIVRVPHHLAARVPDGVGLESAAFTPLAAIALQGVRLAELTLGETVVVFGLGLVGLLTVQIVRAHGCRCIGIDKDRGRVELAREFGALGLVAGEEPIIETVRRLTHGFGADAVLMTLTAESDEPIHQAASMARKRGRIVLVGVTGLQLRRSDFYEKELTFQVSCSYGPGRYDPEYETKGRDYPLPFVRWTEQRNFEAVLSLMADGRLVAEPLVTHRYPIGEARSAYDLLAAGTPSLGILLTYPEPEAGEGREATIRLREPSEPRPGKGVVGVIGAGSFARRTLLPAVREAGFEMRTIVSSGGLSASLEGEASGAEFASSDIRRVLDDPEIDTVLVLTRHASHATLSKQALRAGKHVFVEKPLALTMADLDELEQVQAETGCILTVGFNRRFAPLTSELRQLVAARAGPLALIMTVNAGHIDREHWTQDPERGGGRIIGEACHFIDLARFLCGAPITGLNVRSARDRTGGAIDDIAHLVLSFGDGSTAAIHYLSNGSSQFPKERIEAFFDGRVAAIDNWRRLRTWGDSRRNPLFRRRLDKGHEIEIQRLLGAVRTGGDPPIPLAELFEVSRWSIRAARAAACRGARHE